MNRIKIMLLLPAIFPFILILSLSYINQKSTSSIRFLIWRSPPASIGLLTSIGASSAFFLSSLQLYLLNKHYIRTNRKVVINAQNNNFNEMPDFSDFEDNLMPERIDSPYIERDFKEPAPTVSVPFRIISKSNLKSPGLSTANSVSPLEKVENPLNTEAKSQINQPNNDLTDDWIEKITDEW